MFRVLIPGALEAAFGEGSGSGGGYGANASGGGGGRGVEGLGHSTKKGVAGVVTRFVTRVR